MKLRASYLVAASALSLTVATPRAFATDNAEITDQIVVTGTYLYTDQVNALRTPTPIIDVPQSLTIFTADQFQLQGFSSVGEIIN